LVKWGLCDERGIPVRKRGSKGRSELHVEEGDAKGKWKGKGKEMQRSDISGDREVLGDGLPATEDTSMRFKRKGKGTVRAWKRRLESEGGDDDGANVLSKGEGQGEDRRLRLRPRK
jgi:hypothetical protein